METISTKCQIMFSEKMETIFIKCQIMFSEEKKETCFRMSSAEIFTPRTKRQLDYFFFLFSVLKTGVVSQAQGSAYIEQNETKVICAV